MYTKILRKVANAIERMAGHCGGGTTGHCS
jgi:hypothetical protein